MINLIWHFLQYPKITEEETKIENENFQEIAKQNKKTEIDFVISDIVHHIFPYLNWNDLSNFFLVCKTWNSYQQNDNIWQQFCLKYSKSHFPNTPLWKDRLQILLNWERRIAKEVILSKQKLETSNQHQHFFLIDSQPFAIYRDKDDVLLYWVRNCQTLEEIPIHMPELLISSDVEEKQKLWLVLDKNRNVYCFSLLNGSLINQFSVDTVIPPIEWRHKYAFSGRTCDFSNTLMQCINDEIVIISNISKALSKLYRFDLGTGDLIKQIDIKRRIHFYSPYHPNYNFLPNRYLQATQNFFILCCGPNWDTKDHLMAIHKETGKISIMHPLRTCFDDGYKYYNQNDDRSKTCPYLRIMFFASSDVYLAIPRLGKKDNGKILIFEDKGMHLECIQSLEEIPYISFAQDQHSSFMCMLRLCEDWLFVVNQDKNIQVWNFIKGKKLFNFDLGLQNKITKITNYFKQINPFYLDTSCFRIETDKDRKRLYVREKQDTSNTYKLFDFS